MAGALTRLEPLAPFAPFAEDLPATRPVVIAAPSAARETGLEIVAPGGGEASAGRLVIDGSGTFGAGTHPSTRLLLAAVWERARPGGAVLDVGTGSGIVALGAARRGARALGIDVDEAAIACSPRSLVRP